MSPPLFLFLNEGVPSLTEDQLNSMCPSAAAIAAIVKPDMKFFDVSSAGFSSNIYLKIWVNHVEIKIFSAEMG